MLSEIIIRNDLEDKLKSLHKDLCIVDEPLPHDGKIFFKAGLRVGYVVIFPSMVGEFSRISYVDANYWLDFLRKVRFGKNGFLEEYKLDLDKRVEVKIVINDVFNSYKIETLRMLGVPIGPIGQSRVFQATIYVGTARFISNLDWVDKIELINQKPRN